MVVGIVRVSTLDVGVGGAGGAKVGIGVEFELMAGLGLGLGAGLVEALTTGDDGLLVLSVMVFASGISKARPKDVWLCDC